MTFFTAVNGHLYAADLVEEIVLPEGASESDLQHWSREGRVVLRSGIELAVEYGQLLALLAAPAHLVPAQPGTALVSYDGYHDRMCRSPVLAFAYTRKGELVPVTGAGAGYSRRSDAIVTPSGAVENATGGWPNEDAWRAYAIDDYLHGDKMGR